MKLDQSHLLGAKCLLLDFDGPVCSVFAGYPAHQIASELVEAVSRFDVQLGLSLKDEHDPMEVLRVAAADLPEASAEQLNAQLDQAEVDAVRTAEPTSGAAQLIERAGRAGLTVAIVSNNGEKAIATYLRAHGLDGQVATIEARPFGRPELMKPDPYLLLRALSTTGFEAQNAVFIGDSKSDVEAGLAAGVATIGYANKPGKDAALREAGASSVVTEL
ncbi:HAD-IA family hydrolase [Glycomyces sp. NPDC049804]|uniref:HAD family hydrolase n=1 Tax=Glycomyces sp. NPDC049804 TaxID=3154363 RepID=UPI003422BD0F